MLRRLQELVQAFWKLTHLSDLQAAFTLLPVRFVRAVSCLVRQQRHQGASRLKGDQLFDMICVGIFLVTVLFLRYLNAGAIYFWIKDLTQEFLKLQVIYTAVELFDKVLFFGSISQNCQSAVVGNHSAESVCGA